MNHDINLMNEIQKIELMNGNMELNINEKKLFNQIDHQIKAIKNEQKGTQKKRFYKQGEWFFTLKSV